LNDFAKELEARGHPADYAGLIGDVIEEDETGKWIVRDASGRIIDWIDPLPLEV